MKSSVDGTHGVTQPSRSGQISTVSERKLKANRENAKKSSGPKTPRGKAYSRRNALRHGLCAKKLLPEFHWPGEDEDDFYKICDSLMRSYPPRDVLEALEVKNLADCLFRRVRARRYETAEIRLAQAKFRIGALYSSQTPLHLLEGAQREIEAGNGMPKELEKQIFAAYPPLEQLWPRLKHNARILAQQQHLRLVLATVRVAIDYLVAESKMVYDNVLDLGLNLAAIPNRDAVDRLLRYEPANDRALSRSLDRLDRLHKRPLRPGGPVLSAI
jgi:hypothetical protein